MSEKQPQWFDQMLDGLSPRTKSLFLLVVLGLSGCAPAINQTNVRGKVEAMNREQLALAPINVANTPEAVSVEQPMAAESASATALKPVSDSVYELVANRHFNLFQSEIFDQVEAELGVSGVYIAVIDDRSSVWQIFSECHLCDLGASFYLYPGETAFVFKSEQAAIAHMIASGLPYNIVSK